MKSLNKTIRSKDVRVKIFVNDYTSTLERDINEWLSENDYEILSIELNSDDRSRRVMILYRV